MHEEAQRERDPHGAVSKLLVTAHGRGGGGVVGGGVGGLCCWETHEGLRPRGVWSSTEHHREPFGEPGKEPLESPGAVRGARGDWDGGAVQAELVAGMGFILTPVSLVCGNKEATFEHVIVSDPHSPQTL